jgi:hypothetical protein
MAFVYAASQENASVAAFCLTIALTGARISELLALTDCRIDAGDESIIFETDARAAAENTRGGNETLSGSRKLHGMWDTIPVSWDVSKIKPATRASFDKAAAAIVKTPGSYANWPEKWASETVVESGTAFRGLSFGAKHGKTWDVTVPKSYSKTRSDEQRKQVVKAGARLAQLLNAIWPKSN